MADRYPDLPYMTPDQAAFMRGLIAEQDLRSLLELGTYHGKGTAFLAEILEDLGRGHVTTLDRSGCLDLKPNVKEVIRELGLEDRVTVELHSRSFSITLMRMLEAKPRASFDFCYLDGGHTWDSTALSFLLVDRLLRPGGWLVLDDLDWTIAASPSYKRSLRQGKSLYRSFDDEEKAMAQVRKVWEILVPEAGYVNLSEPGFGWGVAQKVG